jgi:tetratricopeptide (TPR) repeat protein
LIRVSDDRHLWADNYERALMEVFAVQADIAEKIVEQLGITLVETDKETLANIPTDNAEAYQLYLRALNSLRRGEDDSDPRKDLDSVIILDSSFALAYALRSETYSHTTFTAPNTENANIALESARKSLELEPGLPQGHLALGYYYHYVETDYDLAMEQFSLAKSELHNDPELLVAISFAQIRQGNVNEALENRRKAAELDPLNTKRHTGLCSYLRYARKFDEALRSVDRAIALEQDKPSHYSEKISLYASWYGEIDSVLPIALEALKHCDTSEFARDNWWLGRYTTILPWDSLVSEYIQEIREKDSSNYRGIYDLYEALGDSEMIGVYADSAKDSLVNLYNDQPENPNHPSNYGSLLSYLGECELAIEMGLKAKELLSIEECHY